MKFQKGFYADIRVERRYSASVKIRDGVVEECKETTTARAFLRVFDGEMWYYASTYRLGGIQEELDRLYAGATPRADILSHPVVARIEANRQKLWKFKENCVKNVPLSEKKKYLEERLPALASPYLKMGMARYADLYVQKIFVSSKGADLGFDFQLAGVGFGASLASEGETFETFFKQTKDSFSALNVSQEDVKKSVEEGETFLLRAKPVVPGVYPVILSPEVAGVFAHESFGHKSEADFMLGDETMKREWQLGKRVGSEILSITDSGEGAGSGYCPFDDEGTRAGKTYLIKDGVLAGRLHSAETAADLGEETTGNARAVNCEFEPIVRMTSTVIEAGDTPKEELFARIRHGYFIKSYKHGSGMSTFTIAPHLAYEIVDGKIAGPVKIAVITGNVFETLGKVDGLSDRVEVVDNVFGGCGKMEQSPLTVSFGGPYVSISGMNVQ